MQPLRLAADPEAGLVQVLERCRGHLVAHGISEALAAPSRLPADPGNGRGDQRHPEEIRHRLGQPLLRQQLVMQQVEHKGGDPRAVLDRRGDPCGKDRPRLLAADRARQAYARCSVTTNGRGSGKSNTCRATWSVAIAAVKAVPHVAQAGGEWSTVVSGVSVRRKVLPGWPGCPPVCWPDGCRRLPTRGGFFSPSLDGGLPLLPLFSPRRRSNSAIRSRNPAISAAWRVSCASTSSISSPFVSSLRVARSIEALNRQPGAASNKI